MLDNKAFLAAFHGKGRESQREFRAMCAPRDDMAYAASLRFITEGRTIQSAINKAYEFADAVAESIIREAEEGEKLKRLNAQFEKGKEKIDKLFAAKLSAKEFEDTMAAAYVPPKKCSKVRHLENPWASVRYLHKDESCSIVIGTWKFDLENIGDATLDFYATPLVFDLAGCRMQVTVPAQMDVMVRCENNRFFVNDSMKSTHVFRTDNQPIKSPYAKAGPKFLRPKQSYVKETVYGQKILIMNIGKTELSMEDVVVFYEGSKNDLGRRIPTVRVQGEASVVLRSDSPFISDGIPGPVYRVRIQRHAD